MPHCQACREVYPTTAPVCPRCGRLTGLRPANVDTLSNDDEQVDWFTVNLIAAIYVTAAACYIVIDWWLP